jgi:hypothetical protein
MLNDEGYYVIKIKPLLLVSKQTKDDFIKKKKFITRNKHSKFFIYLLNL